MTVTFNPSEQRLPPTLPLLEVHELDNVEVPSNSTDDLEQHLYSEFSADGHRHRY